MDICNKNKKELQDEDSWIPKTPYKPILPKPLIYSNRQENQIDHANETFSSAFSSGDRNWEEALNALAAERNTSFGTCKFDNCNFTTLMILQDQASTRENRKVDFLPAPNGHNSNYMQESQYGLHITSGSAYDLNLFPGGSEVAFSSKMTSHNSQIAPVTPEKGTSLEREQVAQMQCLPGDERANQRSNELHNEIATTDVDTNRLETDELQKPEKDTSFSAVCEVTKENHNLDKEGCHDVSKTPEQKPRRKKHRPRVITEGKPRPQKPVTPKNAPNAESSTGKRKYVRKKPLSKSPITNPAESVGDRTTPAESTENPTGKRKYTHRKPSDKISTPPAEETGESTNTKAIQPAKKSCRRSLQFDHEGQPEDDNSKCKSTSNEHSQPQAHDVLGGNRANSTVTLGHGIEVVVETSQTGIAYDLTRSVNQMLQDYILSPEKQAPSTKPTANTCTTKGEKNNNSLESNAKGEDQVTAHHVQQNMANIMMQPENQLPPVNPNASNNTYTTLIKEEQRNGSKRKLFSLIQQPGTCNTNLTGILHNSLPQYQAAPWLHFPSIHKKRRTEKAHNITASSTSCLTTAECTVRLNITDPQNYTREDAPTSMVNCSIPAQFSTVGIPHAFGESGAFQYKIRTPGSVLAQTTKKRSKCPARSRDLASLTKISAEGMHLNHTERQTSVDYNVQQVGDLNRPHACIDTLVAEMHGTMTTKKRTKKSLLVSSASSSTNVEHSHGKIILCHQNPFSASSSGAPPEVIWKQMYSADIVAELLQHLDINNQCSSIAYAEQNAIVPYGIGNEQQKALVLYRSDGTIIPFTDSSIKKRRPRPKVDLDEETNKVWRLLLGNINSEGIDGTDENKAKWWKEERNVFRGRANSFIARMHLVQGDRRFSQWKGSVVDSVVGVFLTQNVSDHLSSSAFMSLAANFPLKSQSNSKPCYEERIGSVIDKPIVCMPDQKDTIKWNEEMSNQSICDQTSMTLHDTELDEEREVIYSNESSTSSTGIVSSNGLEMYYESAENTSTTEIIKIIDTSDVGEKAGATNDALSSQTSLVSSQNSEASPIAQTAERKEAFSENNSEGGDVTGVFKSNGMNSHSSFMELLIKAGSKKLHEVHSNNNESFVSDQNSKDEANKITIKSQPQVQNSDMQQKLYLTNLSEDTSDTMDSSSSLNKTEKKLQKTTEQNMIEHGFSEIKELDEMNAAKRKAKSRRVGDEIKDDVDWDALRKQAEANGKRERTPNTMDSLDWEAVRCADVSEIADTIKERGMNNILAERIKSFLNRLVREHGSIDLEWLRDIPPDKAKEYLLSIRGLGLKSVECVRLLTLHHLAFPVDTNVGRIAVRLGWVPLQPLPESLQLHLLELYPVLESIQKYLWPRLCKLDQKTLYELHYQMITFGKVFCTKSKPNCNACPMRGECRHFASAFASARLALTGPEEKGIVTATKSRTNEPNPAVMISRQPLPLPQPAERSEETINQQPETRYGINSCEPIVEEPSSPEPESLQVIQNDMEDSFCEDPDEIPTIKLNIEEFTQNLQNYMQNNMELQEHDMSKALVALTAEAASIPMPKLKNVSRLRTEHHVYELPDSHPILHGLDRREPDDPCSYLLAIWTPGETANSIQPPESSCNSQEYGKLCNEKTCFSCNSTREANSQIVRGTLLIPCRTAMRGSFPLNGTYFQVNEVFADHDSSLSPIDVPRSWIWNLPRRTVYFGTSIPTIFKGLTTEGIQHCFWRGFVCVRGFDQKTRAPRPLMARLHFPASKLNKGKQKDSNE